MGIEALFTPSLPQADWRIVATAQRPDTLGALTQGVNLGSGLADMYRQNQFRQAAQGAFDPASGEMNTGAMLRALMQYDPPAAIRFMQQKRLEDQEQIGLRYLMGGGGQEGPGTSGPAGEGSPVVEGAGVSPEARKNLLAGALLSGNVGQGVMKLGELAQAAYLQDYNRQRQLVDTGYTDAQGYWHPGKTEYRYLMNPPVQQQPPGAQLQPAISNIPSDVNSNSFSISKDTWNSMDSSSRVTLLRKMTPGQRNLFIQQMYASDSTGVNEQAPPPGNQPPIDNRYQRAKAVGVNVVGTIDSNGKMHPLPESNVTPPTMAGGPSASTPNGFIPGGTPVMSEQQKLDYANRLKQQDEQRAEQYKIQEEQRRIQQEQDKEQRAIPNTLTTEGAKTWIDTVYKPLLADQKTNQEMLKQFDIVERLNKSGISGPGAQFKMKGKYLLAALGVPQSYADVATEQELIAYSNKLVWNLLAIQKGPQTENDFIRMQAGYPSIDKSEDANQFLVDSGRAIINWNQRKADFYRKHFSEAVKSGDPSSLDDMWMASPDANRSIWNEPEMKKWADKFPAAEPTPRSETETPATSRAQQLVEEARRRGLIK